MISNKDKIYIAGHTGMLGSAIHRLLSKKGFNNIISASHQELNLTDSRAVENFFRSNRPDVVILAAAKVGGIQANIDFPAEFLYENLMIQSNVIHHSYLNSVKNFCFLGSSCIYPKECLQPMSEEYLLAGPLEPTNEGYALAKISGLKMIEYYKRQYGFSGMSLMPCNLYGTNDSFDPLHSHVLSALVKKIDDATELGIQEICLWGSGVARREFMHVDDAAAATLFFLESNVFASSLINVGWGEDISIKELASKIALKAGYKGSFTWDTTKPDGMLKKCLDISKMKDYGFTPTISLDEGILKTIEEYKALKINKGL